MHEANFGRTVAVVGPGAVGVGIGAWLLRAGFAPLFFGRDGPVAIDVPLRWTDGALTRLTRPAAGGDPWPAVAGVVVAVKAFDLAAALTAVGAVAPGTPVIPVANGAVEGLVAAAAAARPALAWRRGFCTFGVSREATGYALRSRRGQMHWGPLSASAPAAPTAFERALGAAPEAHLAGSAPAEAAGGPPFFCWHDDVRPAQRRKWLYNVVMNTLGAARRLPTNGDLLGDAPMLTAVFGEAYRLGESLWGPWTLGRDALYGGLLELIESTAANENSMARDRRLGRRTETAFLAGLAADEVAYPLLTSLHRALLS